MYTFPSKDSAIVVQSVDTLTGLPVCRVLVGHPTREHSYGRPKAAVGAGVRPSTRDRTLRLGALYWYYHTLARGRAVRATRNPATATTAIRSAVSAAAWLRQQDAQFAVEPDLQIA